MPKLNISEKGSFYVCHRCLLFKCNSKNDMKRHYQRINQCTPNIIINDNTIQDKDFFYNKSISHRYVIEMNINFLLDFHIHLIINNFNHIYNIITFDVLNSLINDEKLKLIKNDYNYNIYYEKLINKDNENFNKKCTNTYKCTNCFSEFSSIYILNNHQKNINYCNKKRELNLLKDESLSLNEYSTSDLIKKYYEKDKIIQNHNIQNIKTQNINNIQNINIQNINNQINNNNFIFSP